MPNFHFIDDYERYVNGLIEEHPLDEAMELAVGGNYQLVGEIEVEILKIVGITSGNSIVDLGCGSGRLSTALYKENLGIDFTGIDVIKSMLQYAKTKAPDYRFILHHGLSIPFKNEAVDIISAFSLFTHLQHAETYLYLQDAQRVLRKNGKIIFSFLEFSEPGHWNVFESTVLMTKNNTVSHLNTFIERSVIELWAKKLGFNVDGYINAGTPILNGHPLGQSCVILTKI